MSWFKKIIKAPERFLSKVIPHQHAADRRAANALVAAQLEAYKNTKGLLEQEFGRLAEEKKIEKDKLAHRQMRALDFAFRAPSIMGDESVSGGTSSSLTGM